MNLKLPAGLGLSQSRGALVTKAEDFRAKAAECDKLASRASDAEARRMFQEAADNWRVMAKQAERMKR